MLRRVTDWATVASVGTAGGNFGAGGGDLRFDPVGESIGPDR